MGRYDEIIEVKKEVGKFNPYHDARGRFSTSDGAASFTYKPGKSRAHDLAIEREKKRHAESEAKKPAAKPAPKKKGNQESQGEHPGGEYGKTGVTAKVVAVTSKLTGTDAEEARTLARAARQFTTNDYDAIRKYQRLGPPPDRKQVSKEIETFIEKSPKWDGGEVYRGLDIDKATAAKIVADARAGKQIGMLGTSSWSTNKKIAEAFADSQGDEVSFIFRSKGKQNGTSVKYLSRYPQEDEVLMSKDARWKPVKVTESPWGSTFYIDCEPIYG